MSKVECGRWCIHYTDYRDWGRDSRGLSLKRALTDELLFNSIKSCRNNLLTLVLAFMMDQTPSYNIPLLSRILSFTVCRTFRDYLYTCTLSLTYIHNISSHSLYLRFFTYCQLIFRTSRLSFYIWPISLIDIHNIPSFPLYLHSILNTMVW